MNYKKHIFVCENTRKDLKRKSCGIKGQEIRACLKKMVYDNGLKEDVRVNRSGCLDQCENGPCLVIYPEGKWYTEIDKNDCKNIFLTSISKKE